MTKKVAGLAFFAVEVGGFLAVPAAAQQAGGLTVHGYLTQGVAGTDGAPVYGLTNAVTTDYRAMALQFRYGFKANDALVVQLGHRRLALSAVQAVEPDAAVDWAFYQTLVAGNTVKAGRIPMPRGLFNEVRQVGAIFPFFRASKAFYSEGVETVDGVSVSRGINIGGGFGVDAAAYAGGFDLKVELVDADGPALITNRQRSAAGAHVLVSTPVNGLRVSADYVRSTNAQSGGKLAIATTSVDYTRDRMFARGEYELAKSMTRTGGDNTDYVAYYGQAGVGITPKLWLNWQYEVNTLTLHYLPLPAPLEYDNIKDQAFGLSYKFSPQVVLKGEYHNFTGYQLDKLTPPLNPATGQSLPPGKTKYFIFSLSTAF